MNNEPTAIGEPVAWAMFVDGDFMDAIHPNEHDRVEGKYTVPLYTHPADLTDEEIMNLALEIGWKPNALGLLTDFARAILRKAQEK